MRSPRWTKPQASALALLKGGRRLRFKDTKFVVFDPVTDQDQVAVVAMATVLRLARAGAVELVCEGRQLFARLPFKQSSQNTPRGKDAAAGAYLEDELA